MNVQRLSKSSVYLYYYFLTPLHNLYIILILNSMLYKLYYLKSNSNMLNILKLKKTAINQYFINKGDAYAGEMKHYVPATKEWFNSVYSYNKNSIKALPSADRYVIKLIKSYFNLFNSNFEKKARIPVIRFKKRRLKMNKIHVGKPEFKHTNDKVIITLYIFNQQLVNYIKKINKIKGLNYLNAFAKKIKSKKRANLLPSFKNKIYLLKKTYTNFINDVKTLNYNYNDILGNYKFNIDKLPIIHLIKKILIKLRLYLRIKRIIYFNKSKFNSIHIIPLKILLQKIYGKTVEFNIVSLKDYHLNSSILTEIMGIKLKDRNNRVLRVIGKVLRFGIPYTRRLHYPGKKRKILSKKNVILRDSFNNNYFKVIPHIEIRDKKFLSKNDLERTSLIKTLEKDNLNSLLKSIYPNEYIFNKRETSELLFIKKRNVINTVLDKIKNKSVVGIRIEASGRLSKRLIASRSVFKMRQIGTIKNINSSFRKAPSVLLRGNFNSNLNYSRYSDKTRIGAFGLKGWINTY